MRFYCVRRNNGSVTAAKTLEAETAIEALREAALWAGYSGTWTAYREVVTKEVTIERKTTARVLFK